MSLSANHPFPSRDEWEIIERLFTELVKLPRDVALRRLEEMPDVSPRIRQEVAAMLECESDSPSLLDEGTSGGADSFTGEEPASRLGQYIGPYRCEEILPRGGMGVVYRGMRQNPTREAAIKILLHAWIESTRVRDFEEEIQTLATLTHAGIAQLYEGGTSAGTPWFAMEFVRGRRIDEWLAARQASVREVLQLFQQLCVAIQYVHERNVFHCDLKPSNVLVTDRGEVKVIDFGVAKRYAEPPRGDVRTERAVLQMTPEYAAPEQVEGMRPTAHTDVYAMGIMLHELLVGERPYKVSALSPGGILPTILEGYPWDLGRWPRIRALGRYDLQDLNTIIRRATHPDREKRYGSAAALGADIAAYLEKRPLQGGDVSRLYVAQKFIRRRGRVIAGGAVLGALATAALVSHNSSLEAARDVAMEEAARGMRVRSFLEEMFQVAGTTGLPPESTRVATIIERGIKEANGVKNDPKHRLDMLWSLGLIGERVNTMERNDTLYAAALALSDSIYGHNHPETLRLRIRPARMMFLRGRIDSVEALLAELDSLARKHAPPDHPVNGELALWYGNFYYGTGRGAKGIPHLERAVAFEEARDSTSRELATALRELSSVYFGASDVKRAEAATQRAIELITRRLGPRHYDAAILYANLATFAAQRGDLARAERYQRDAVGILQYWYGPNHYLTAMSEATLAQTMMRQHRDREALALIEQALSTMARFPESGPVTYNYALGQATYAISLNRLGNWPRALAQFDSSIATLRVTFGPKNTSTLRTEANRALGILGQGRRDSAEALLRGLVAKASEAHGPKHLVTLELSVGLAESIVGAGGAHEAISLANGALPRIDSLVTAKSDVALRARRVLARGYIELGDSVTAERWRREAEGSVAARE